MTVHDLASSRSEAVQLSRAAVDAAWSRYQSLVQPGDWDVLVMKGHLEVERALVAFVLSRAGGPEKLKPKVGKRYGPTGSALVSIAKALSESDLVPSALEDRWESLHAIQRLRYLIAHEYDVSVERVESLMRQTALLFMKDELADETAFNVPKLFWYTAQLISKTLDAETPKLRTAEAAEFG
jgi:hypothetical protein